MLIGQGCELFPTVSYYFRSLSCVGPEVARNGLDLGLLSEFSEPQGLRLEPACWYKDTGATRGAVY